MADTKHNPESPAAADTEAGREASQASAQPNTANVLKLDLEGQPGGGTIHQQVAELELLLQQLVARQGAADTGLRDLHSQADKLQGDMNLHLDLTNRKLQAVLEKYTGLKAEAEKLGQHSARFEQELTATRIETESLLGDLEANTQACIEDANQATRELLRKEAEQAEQRHRALTDELQDAARRIQAVEEKASRLVSELESRAKVLQSTIDSVELRLQAELKRIEAEARQRDQVLEQEAARLREAGAMQARRAQQHEARTGCLEQRAEKLQADAAALVERVDGNEARTAGLERRAETQEARTGQLETRAAELENRATEVEGRSTDLEQRSDDLEGRTGNLESETAQLSAATGHLARRQDVLTDRTESLTETTEAHQGQLARLASALRSQLRGFSGVLLLLVVAIAMVAAYFYDQNRALHARSDQQGAEAAQLAASLQAQKAALERELAAQKQALEQSIASERTVLAETDSGLQQEVKDNRSVIQAQREVVEALEQRIATLQDQADSASGRLAALHPLGNFGSDSVVRGESWLAGQDKSQFMVRLLETGDRLAMYKVADRWAYYLEGRNLAYLERAPRGDTVYQLFYGPFELAADAEQFAAAVPSPDTQNPLQVVSVAQLQAE